MVTRRNFVKTLSAAGTLSMIDPMIAFPRSLSGQSGYGINSFIENNPDAVFIMRTEVTSKFNSSQKLLAGQQFAQHVFVPKSPEEGGFQLSNDLLIKPNLTCRYSFDKRYTVDGTMGIQTDCYFMEGIINQLLDLGLSGNKIAFRETNCPEDFDDGGYLDLATRKGLSIADRSAPIGTIDEQFINWVDIPEGVFFNRIPYLAPAHSPNSPILNVAKFKTHSMGVTGCAKNIQGLNALPYVRHCTEYQNEMEVHPDHIQANAKEQIMNNYNRRKDIVPRWDRPERNGGLWQETWATRCLDNNSVTKPALNIIEGIYGRDGHFINGPHSGLAKDFMANVIIFGKNAFHVDNIAHYLAGHEPGNFGLFHMALERNMLTIMDPRKIPVYEWFSNGTAELTPIEDFERTPLKTMYLTRDYNGQTEDRWHLVDEPFDYSGFSSDHELPLYGNLAQNYPNPASGITQIEYSLVNPGHASIEIFDLQMRRVAVLTDKTHLPGAHFVTWNTHQVPAGQYIYRLTSRGISESKRMLVIH